MSGPSGLHNVNIGGISMPAPQFVIMHRGNSEDNRTTNRAAGSGDGAGATGANQNGRSFEQTIQNDPTFQASMRRMAGMGASLGAQAGSDFTRVN
jgi:hypothetical protein